MRINELRGHVRRHPFTPFRVHLADGSSYDVHHHDFIIVGKDVVEIARADGPDEFPETIVSCDPLHISRVEPLSSRHRSNGKKSRPKD